MSGSLFGLLKNGGGSTVNTKLHGATPGNHTKQKIGENSRPFQFETAKIQIYYLLFACTWPDPAGSGHR